MPPSDTEEADAAHRRFLPVPVQQQAIINTITMKGAGGGESEETTPMNKPGERVQEDLDNNFIAIKTETTDYGAIDMEPERLDVQDETEQPSPSKSLPYNKEEKFGFDFSFIKRFYRLHGLLFLSICSATTALFAFLVCLVLLGNLSKNIIIFLNDLSCNMYFIIANSIFLVFAEEYIKYQVGLIASGFYKTLGDKNLEGFWVQTRYSLFLILGVSFVC